MRIRKHAKTAAIAAAIADEVNSATETEKPCRLNQSPWDVAFSPPSPRIAAENHQATPLPPPPPFQRFKDDVKFRRAVGKTTVVDAIDAGQCSRMKKKKKLDDVAASDGGDAAYLVKKEEEEVILCPKVDQEGWQCGAVVRKGKRFCDNHLKKTYAAAIAGKRSDQRASSSGSYEFYYYTGFGPAKSKKRGNDNTPVASTSQQPDSDSDVAGKGMEEKKDVESDESNDKVEGKGSNGRMGKKRGRKVVKARSLKSLM